MRYEVYRDLPILFKGEMVRKIIANQKHKTRRLKAPWNVGDHLWVRETWKTDKVYDPYSPCQLDIASAILWVADGIKRLNGPEEFGKLRPAIFMPKWASRITLEVTEKYQERLQDITEEEAIAEGTPIVSWNEVSGGITIGITPNYKKSFAILWDSINRKRKVDIGTNLKTVYPYSWDANPIVWVTGFKILDIKGI